MLLLPVISKMFLNTPGLLDDLGAVWIIRQLTVLFSLGEPDTLSSHPVLLVTTVILSMPHGSVGLAPIRRWSTVVGDEVAAPRGGLRTTTWNESAAVR
jgi:hypothetical protein